MELELLGASLRSRQDHDLVRSYIDPKLSTYSKPWQVVMSKVAEYYARDGTAEFVSPEVLIAQMEESIRNPKHVARFKELVTDALTALTSDANVRAVVLMAKQQETADRLAVAVTGGGGDVDDLLKELTELRAMSSLDDLNEKGLEVFHNVDLEALMAKEYDPESLIQVYPRSLNERLDGGAKPGHHIVVYGRPESMKTGTAINMNCGFARQNKPSLYLINEDRPEDLILRHISNLSGMTKHQMQEDPRRAQKLARDNGFENIVIMSCSPGTIQQIEQYIEEYEPAVVIIDQLRNLKVKADNRVNQLEYAATAARSLAKKWNVLTISITQAGDSAEGKAVLDMGDVDYSNTGIPAQADVMIGVGVTPTLEAEGLRTFSLPKNKISGIHEAFPVRVIPQLSRVTSV